LNISAKYHQIDPYNFELSRFKFVSFFETVYIMKSNIIPMYSSWHFS